MIVNRIAEAMTSRGKTVAQVSTETGLRYNTVLGLYRGQGTRIELDTIDALCRVLEMQPGDLFQWQHDAPEAEPLPH